MVAVSAVFPGKTQLLTGSPSRVTTRTTTIRGRPCAFFGVAEGTEGIFAIYGEGSGSGIVEDNIYLKVEEISGLKEYLFFRSCVLYWQPAFPGFNASWNTE